MTTAWDQLRKKGTPQARSQEGVRRGDAGIEDWPGVGESAAAKGADSGRGRGEDRDQCSATQPNRAQTGKRQHANLDPVCRSRWHGPRHSPCCTWITYSLDGRNRAILVAVLMAVGFPTFLRFGAILCKEESHFIFMNTNTLFAYVRRIAMRCKTAKIGLKIRRL